MQDTLHLAQEPHCPSAGLLRLHTAKDLIVCRFVADVAHLLVIQNGDQALNSKHARWRIG
jgi:hypothetical protein